MPLLSKRFEAGPLAPVNTAISLRDQWDALYHWRSKIAHRDIPDFSDKPLKKLGDRNAAVQLLRTSLKRLLVLALTEHELISDLKEC